MAAARAHHSLGDNPGRQCWYASGTQLALDARGFANMSPTYCVKPFSKSPLHGHGPGGACARVCIHVHAGSRSPATAPANLLGPAGRATLLAPLCGGMGRTPLPYNAARSLLPGELSVHALGHAFGGQARGVGQGGGLGGSHGSQRADGEVRLLDDRRQNFVHARARALRRVQVVLSPPRLRGRRLAEPQHKRPGKELTSTRAKPGKDWAKPAN